MAIKDKPTANQLAALMHIYGVKHVVVSPGSRNAPVILALSRSGKYELHYIVDERTAAFAALGMAVTLDSPVAMVCTSGSAVLNYGPALAEAYYSRVPLIAISADRPYYEIGQNRPQTICQAGVLGHVVRKSVDIRDGEDPVYANRLLNEALSTATRYPNGPVHINMQFEMPLTESIATTKPYVKMLRHGECIGKTPEIKYDPAKKYLLIIGGLHPDKDIETCRRLIDELPSNVAVIAEAQSNLSDKSIIPSAAFADNIDRLTTPDCVYVAGSPLVSAKIGKWLDTCGLPCVRLSCDDTVYDCDSMCCSLTGLLSSFKSHASNIDYQEKFRQYGNVVPTEVSRLLSLLSRCDIMLHLGNGMTVRDAQRIAIKAPTRIWANRGVSGIDGSTSTAVGASLVSDKPVVLVTGDMSAAYDIGALAVKGVGANFTMIVVNNGGGDIFRHVATTRDLPERDKYFTAMPKFPLRQLAEAYGFEYQAVTNPDDCELTRKNKPKIIELKISR